MSIQHKPPNSTKTDSPINGFIKTIQWKIIQYSTKFLQDTSCLHTLKHLTIFTPVKPHVIPSRKADHSGNEDSGQVSSKRLGYAVGFRSEECTHPVHAGKECRMTVALHISLYQRVTYAAGFTVPSSNHRL